MLYEGRKEKRLFSMKGGEREIERERGIEIERERYGLYEGRKGKCMYNVREEGWGRDRRKGMRAW